MVEKFSCMKDKTLFYKVLRNNTKLMLGKDEFFNNTFIYEFLESVKSVETVDCLKKDKDLKHSIKGYTIFSRVGKPSIKMFGNLNTKENSEYNYKLFSHETWHAMLNVLNCLNSKDAKRTISLDGNKTNVYPHAGFYLCKYIDTMYHVGYLLNECFVDILTNIAYEVKTTGTVNIEDKFYYGIDDDFLYAPYDNFLTLTQLFIAAFNLDTKSSFTKRVESGESLIGNYIAKNVYANIFVEGSLTNPLIIMDEYDNYMGNGKYIEMLKELDMFYENYVSKNIFDADTLYSIMNNLEEFISVRLKHLRMSNIIDDDTYEKLLTDFIEISSVFDQEITSYLNMIENRKFMNRLKKLRR